MLYNMLKSSIRASVVDQYKINCIFEIIDLILQMHFKH